MGCLPVSYRVIKLVVYSSGVIAGTEQWNLLAAHAVNQYLSKIHCITTTQLFDTDIPFRHITHHYDSSIPGTVVSSDAVCAC